MTSKSSCFHVENIGEGNENISFKTTGFVAEILENNPMSYRINWWNENAWKCLFNELKLMFVEDVAIGELTYESLEGLLIILGGILVRNNFNEILSKTIWYMAIS